jgi:hypothetical protein
MPFIFERVQHLDHTFDLFLAQSALWPVDQQVQILYKGRP